MINENAHQDEEELNEEEARERDEEEKERERIRQGRWPSSEWTEDEEEGAVGGNYGANEEARTSEEELEREWIEKEERRVAQGLWPSSEWTEEEEEKGAVGGSYTANERNTKTGNDEPATLQVEMDYIEPIPSRSPPPPPRKLRRRPSSIPRTSRVNIADDYSRVNYAFNKSSSVNNLNTSDDSENEVFSTCFHSYASIHSKKD